MSDYERFEGIMTGKGYNIHSICAKAKVPSANVYFWRAGRSMPKYETLRRLADALGVSVNDFIDESAFRERMLAAAKETDDDKAVRTRDEENLLKGYRSLSDKDKKDVLSYVVKMILEDRK